MLKQLFFDYEPSADEAIRRNYLKEDVGWILENLHLVTE